MDVYTPNKTTRIHAPSCVMWEFSSRRRVILCTTNTYSLHIIYKPVLNTVLPVGREKDCWSTNEPLRCVRNPLVRIGRLYLGITCWWKLTSHVCRDLTLGERAHWWEDIPRCGIGCRGRGGLTNVTAFEGRGLGLDYVLYKIVHVKIIEINQSKSIQFSKSKI